MKDWLNPENVWRFVISLAVAFALIWLVVYTVILPEAGVDTTPTREDRDVFVFPQSIQGTSPEQVCSESDSVVFSNSFRGKMYEAQLGPYAVKWTEGDDQVAFTFGATAADYPFISDTLRSCLDSKAREVLPE